MLGALLEKFYGHGGLAGLSRKRIVRNTLLLYAVQFSNYLFPLLTLPLLGRVLKAEKLGLMVAAQSLVWYFVTLADYGFGLTATRKIAMNRDNPAEVERIFSAVMSAKMCLMAVGFVLMEALVFSVPKFRPEAALYTASFLTVVGNVLFPLWLFQGLQRLGQVALRDFLAKVISTALLFLLIREQSDYLLAATIQSGGAVLAGVIGLLQVRRIVKVRWTWPDWPVVWKEIVESWPVFLSMAAMTATGSTNIVILGLWASAADVGYYSSAYRIVVAVRMMVAPLVTVLYPMLSHMVVTDKARVRRFLNREGLLLPVPFGVVSLLLLVGAPFLVPLLFGDEFLPTVGLLQVLAFSPFLLALSHNYSTYYMLTFGYDREWTRIVLWSVAVNIGVLFLLLWTIPATYAVAVTLVIVDVYSVVAAYLFFRRTAVAA